MEAFIWEMKNILSRRIDCEVFGTECSELVSMVLSHEDWSIISNLLYDFGLLCLSFSFFSQYFISRLCNVHVDCLDSYFCKLYSY